MAITEQAIQLLARVTTEVEARFVDFTDLARGFEHVYRVYHLALSLSEQEQADGLIVGMAALLHAILAHSYRHGTRPATLEARVLYDADRLDSLGASGVMRWAMTARHGR